MSEIIVKKKGPVCTVTLQRPDVRNALNPELIVQLTQVFTQVSQDSSVRVVVLRGAGTSFCAGADIGYMKSMAGFSLAENQADADRLFAMFTSIAECSKPVIGVIQGHAMGGGVGLVAACDYVLAEASTKFCFSEVRLGIVPAVISSFALRKIGYSQSVALMTSADIFSAEKAQSIGLCHFVGTIEQVETESTRVQNLYLSAASSAIAETKKLLRTVVTASDVAKIRKTSVEVIAQQRVSADGQEGLKSFLEKRDPSWKVST